MHIVGKPGNGVFGFDINRIIVNHRNFVDGFTGVGKFGNFLVGQAFKGKFNIIRVECVTIMKFNTLSEVKPPG